MKRFTTAMIFASVIALPGCAIFQPAKPEINAPAPIEESASAAEARRWMTENGARDGIITRPSGLQYAIVKSGENPRNPPSPGQKVKVHYEGRLIDGTIFDSSYERGRPAEFPSDRLITGWVEALSIMSPGDEWTVYIPPALAYGESSVSVIPPNSVLIFRMELIENL